MVEGFEEVEKGEKSKIKRKFFDSVVVSVFYTVINQSSLKAGVKKKDGWSGDGEMKTIPFSFYLFHLSSLLVFFLSFSFIFLHYIFCFTFVLNFDKFFYKNLKKKLLSWPMKWKRKKKQQITFVPKIYWKLDKKRGKHKFWWVNFSRKTKIPLKKNKKN